MSSVAVAVIRSVLSKSLSQIGFVLRGSSVIEISESLVEIIAHALRADLEGIG